MMSPFALSFLRFIRLLIALEVTILLTQNRLTNKIQFQAIRYGNVMTGLPEIDSQFGSIGNKSRNDFSQGAHRTRA
jgi:hypothetical protein